jgi:glyoxylase-like metal-dependent hydrolase (beta-lactamase superfamily II)
VVVDAGWETEAGWNALADGLKAAGASPADVTGIVVTHIHASNLVTQ